MKNPRSFSYFVFDVWLIQQLQFAPSGLTLEELKKLWIERPGHRGNLSRDMLTTHRKGIKDFLGALRPRPRQSVGGNRVVDN